jgi:hypothetical protein
LVADAPDNTVRVRLRWQDTGESAAGVAVQLKHAAVRARPLAERRAAREDDGEPASGGT